MHDYLETMKVAMELKGFSEATQKAYLAQIRHYERFSGKHPAACGYDEVRAFLHHEIKVRKLSSSYVNIAYGAIKFFYQTALCREWNMQYVPRIKQKRFLPTVLTLQEVEQVIDSVSNLKHKAMLTVCYTSGLRVSECTHLKVSDVHSDNMRLYIRSGKGDKDRYSILSHRALKLLREYWKVYRPKDWLFPGAIKDMPISVRTLQAVFKDAITACGITKAVSIHSLRHSFATHLLNKGANILQIKDLLGHGDIQTTTRYLHLTNAQVLGIKSPYDTEDAR